MCPGTALQRRREPRRSLSVPTTGLRSTRVGLTRLNILLRGSGAAQRLRKTSCTRCTEVWTCRAARRRLVRAGQPGRSGRTVGRFSWPRRKTTGARSEKSVGSSLSRRMSHGQRTAQLRHTCCGERRSHMPPRTERSRTKMYICCTLMPGQASIRIQPRQVPMKPMSWGTVPYYLLPVQT
jgi:hypothetical protein